MRWSSRLALSGVVCGLLAAGCGARENRGGGGGGGATEQVAAFSACRTPVEQLSPVSISRFPGASTTTTIDPERELTVRDVSVVDDARASYPGSWSFGHLVEQLSGPNDPSAVTQTWLAHWLADQTINTFNVPARTRICDEVINPWLDASGCAPIDCSAPTPAFERDCRLDFGRAPFRLLEIVNRVDLMRTGEGGYGGAGGGFCGRDPRPRTDSRVLSAGEGRFVWGVLDREGNALPFTVIFEYELPALSMCEVQRWAEQWHALGSVPFGPGYNDALERITLQFTEAGLGPGRANDSLLNQLRTNENALDRVWELREFKLSCRDGLLREVEVHQTPDLGYDQTATLAQFLDLNASASVIEVPLSFLGMPFLGGNAPVTNGFWARPAGNPGINDQTHNFSVNTCNGCHSRETDTRFLHTETRPAGMRSELSLFVRGDSAQPDGYLRVSDPRDPTCRTWLFNDWRRRADDLAGFVTRECSRELEEMATREGGVSATALRSAESFARGSREPALRTDERVRINPLRVH